MASNKRREGLDQPTGNTLTALDKLLASLKKDELEADEFTAQMIAQKSGRSLNSIRSILTRMKNSGELTSRKFVINGSVANVYKSVDK